MLFGVFFLGADLRPHQYHLAIDWIAGFLFGWYLRAAELSTIAADVRAIIEAADRHVWIFFWFINGSMRIATREGCLLWRRSFEHSLSCDEPAAAHIQRSGRSYDGSCLPVARSEPIEM